MSLVEQALKKMRGKADIASPSHVRDAVSAHRQERTRELAPALVKASNNRIVKFDRAALHAAGVLPPPKDERLLAQEFRHIKRPLIAAAMGRSREPVANGQRIMIASALPGDGKTFTSVNLALSMALEKELNVLLVDADVAKAHISRIFGIERDPGLLDVLRREDLDVESVVLPTDVPGLSVLSAGSLSDTATELLASARMEEIARELVAHNPNRILLFDSPPLLLTTESRALSSIAGQILLVVSAGVTPQKAVFEALELLGDGRNVSLVLNQSDEGSRSSYHDYYSQSAAPPAG